MKESCTISFIGRAPKAMQQISPAAFTAADALTSTRQRSPPGQHVVNDFPVLSAGLADCHPPAGIDALTACVCYA